MEVLAKRAHTPWFRGGQRGQLCGGCAGWVESGVATLPGQTGQHLLLDLLPVAVLTLGRQQAAHGLSGR